MPDRPPEITLLVPCYNAARFLPRLAAHVRALTQPFADILCFDDGSTDDTVAVAQELGWRILTPNVNRGVAHARNQLVAATRTEWIHFHDADDIIAPTYVERLAPWCNERHDVVSCNADWIDEASRGVVVAWRYDPVQLELVPLIHLLTNPMGLNNSVIRRNAWEKIHGCDESLAMWEDADVHVRLAHAGARFHHIPEVLTQSLRRSDSFSHDYRKSWNCRLKALRNYSGIFPPDCSPALVAELESAAHALLRYDDPAGAREALVLARSLGGDPPATANPILKLCKRTLGAMTALRLQAFARRS